MEYEKAQILAMKLDKYAKLEGSEIGETCLELISLVRCRDYVSPEFYTALCNEMKKQLDNFKANTRITKVEESYVRKVDTLEWKGIDY